MGDRLYAKRAAPGQVQESAQTAFQRKPSPVVDPTRLPLWATLAYGNQVPPSLRLPLAPPPQMETTKQESGSPAENDTGERLQRATQTASQEEEAQHERAEPLQHKENTTGLPDTLKVGIESLSGQSLDNVQVHYHSSKPAEVQALAYAQGTDIHVGPGQERHLAHEAWHVVQQRQRCVHPTAQMQGIAINDDPALEREADVMGKRAENDLVPITTQKKGITTYETNQITRPFDTLTPPVQRTIENQTHNDPTRKALAELFFQAYDKKVQEAYLYAVTIPSLKPFDGLNNNTKLWAEKWDLLANKGGRPSMVNATFGYVIEALVSEPAAPYVPTPPSGYSVLPQQSIGNTRPDLVLVDPTGKHIAWLDVTSSDDAGHILRKDDWEQYIQNYAEVTYPSLKGETLALMLMNKDNTGTVSQEEFEEKQAKAKKEYRGRKAHWKALGEKFKFSHLKKELVNIYGSMDVLNMNPMLKTNFIINKIIEEFKLTDEAQKEEMMNILPSILVAMKVPLKPWGYAETDVRRANKRAGQVWLTVNVPEDKKPAVAVSEPMEGEAEPMVTEESMEVLS